jgi:hypothetical protein
MGIDLHVEDEHGEAIEIIPDDQNILSKIINTYNTSSCTLLKYIDPYGDTVFNHKQLNDLINDFSQIMNNSNESITKVYLRKVNSILVRNVNKVHVYFKFYGD